MKKYIVHSGEIESKEDGQYKFITCGQLMELYEVNPDECILDSGTFRYRGPDEGFIHLYPQFNKEDYDLTKLKINSIIE